MREIIVEQGNEFKIIVRDADGKDIFINENDYKLIYDNLIEY